MCKVTLHTFSCDFNSSAQQCDIISLVRVCLHSSISDVHILLGFIHSHVGSCGFASQAAGLKIIECHLPKMSSSFTIFIGWFSNVDMYDIVMLISIMCSNRSYAIFMSLVHHGTENALIIFWH